jgi:hypothetical protein
MNFGRLSHIVGQTVRDILIAATMIVCTLSGIASKADEFYGAPPDKIKEFLDRLVNSYPDKISRHDGEILFLKDGRQFPISDKRTREEINKLRSVG